MIFAKPVTQISAADLQELLTDQAVENLRLEFKCEIATKDETLKKLSARKKKPSVGRGTPLATRRNRCSSECDSRVPNRKFLEPPSALNRKANAMASNRVDLPEPFSPTKNVTAGWNSNRSKCRTAGRQKGYCLNDFISSRFKRNSARYFDDTTGVGNSLAEL